jgi:hypothetical protein
MQFPPPAVILTWPTANLVNPETHGNGVLIDILIFFPLAAILVSIRTFTRIHILKSFGIDDILAILAMVSTCVVQS